MQKTIAISMLIVVASCGVSPLLPRPHAPSLSQPKTHLKVTPIVIPDTAGTDEDGPPLVDVLTEFPAPEYLPFPWTLIDPSSATATY